MGELMEFLLLFQFRDIFHMFLGIFQVHSPVLTVISN